MLLLFLIFINGEFNLTFGLTFNDHFYVKGMEIDTEELTFMNNEANGCFYMLYELGKIAF